VQLSKHYKNLIISRPSKNEFQNLRQKLSIFPQRIFKLPTSITSTVWGKKEKEKEKKNSMKKNAIPHSP